MPARMSNFLQRVLFALVAAPIAGVLAYLGGWGWAALVLVIALAAQWEVYRLFERAGARPYRLPGLVIGAALVLHSMVPGAVPFAVVAVLAVAVLALGRQGGKPLLDVGATAFGALYPAGLLGFLVALRVGPPRALGVQEVDGFWVALGLMLAIWASDTFAYFAGRAFGKHPLFPRVSPKKTWEGAVGGFAGAAVVAAFLVLGPLDGVLDAWDGAVLAVSAGVLGPLGDLFESLLKRSVDVKDSGALLPGHGGVLDRFDAMAFATPAFAVWLEAVRGLW